MFGSGVEKLLGAVAHGDDSAHFLLDGGRVVHAPACGLGGVEPGDLEDALRSGDDVDYAVAAAPSQALGRELGVLGSLLEQIKFQALELSVVKTGRVGEKRDALADELRGLLGIALVMGARVNGALLDGLRGNDLLK